MAELIMSRGIITTDDLWRQLRKPRLRWATISIAGCLVMLAFAAAAH